jgi:hypothetical protein
VFDSQNFKKPGKASAKKRYVLIFISSTIVIFIYQNSICYTVSNDVLSAGKIPPRKPMTRLSPRAPKLKEAEIGEGYYPNTTRQLEYAPRVDPFIKNSTKKAFIQPPFFGNT